MLSDKCNRATKRALNLPKDLLAIDSTTVTVGKNRIKWAKFKREKSGIKLHLALNVTQTIPSQVEETIANIYKERWKVETFFRFIKQNLNAKRFFGTSENAVYNQLFSALIAYIILYFTHAETSKR